MHRPVEGEPYCEGPDDELQLERLRPGLDLGDGWRRRTDVLLVRPAGIDDGADGWQRELDSRLRLRRVRHQSGSSANYWLYTGEQRDSDSSFYYLRARYYDPAIGRFLGQDPLSGHGLSPQTLNPYAYGLNNPVLLIDPSGHFSHKSLWNETKKVGEGLVQVAKAAAPYVVDCAAWGAVGFAVTGGQVAGAAAGCATAIGGRLWKDLGPTDPLLQGLGQCVIWAAGGVRTAIVAGASKLAYGAGGCLGGGGASLSGGSAPAQCGVWAIAGAVAAAGNRVFRLGQVAVGAATSCLAALASNQASDALASGGLGVGAGGKE